MSSAKLRRRRLSFVALLVNYEPPSSKLNESFFFSVEANADDGQVELRGDLESREREREELKERLGKNHFSKLLAR